MLNSNQVRPNQRNMVHLAEHPNHPGVINARNQDTQQINQKRWLLLEVKRESLVVSEFTVNIISNTTVIALHFHVGHSHNSLLELIVFPSICRTFNHGKGCIILGNRQITGQATNSATYKFVIFDVQKHQLRPQMSSLCRFDDLGNIDTSHEQFEMLHHCNT